MNGLAYVALATALFLATPASAEPLSCRMKGMLAQVSAMARDAGASEKETRAKLLGGGELSSQEVDAILRVSYGKAMRNVPPETIGQTVYNVCVQVNGHR